MRGWIPASAGMTTDRVGFRCDRHAAITIPFLILPILSSCHLRFILFYQPQRNQRKQRTQSLGTGSSPTQEDTEFGDREFPKPGGHRAWGPGDPQTKRSLISLFPFSSAFNSFSTLREKQRKQRTQSLGTGSSPTPTQTNASLHRPHRVTRNA